MAGSSPEANRTCGLSRSAPCAQAVALGAKQAYAPTSDRSGVNNHAAAGGTKMAGRRNARRRRPAGIVIEKTQ